MGGIPAGHDPGRLRGTRRRIVGGPHGRAQGRRLPGDRYRPASPGSPCAAVALAGRPALALTFRDGYGDGASLAAASRSGAGPRRSGRTLVSWPHAARFPDDDAGVRPGALTAVFCPKPRGDCPGASPFRLAETRGALAPAIREEHLPCTITASSAVSLSYSTPTR